MTRTTCPLGDDCDLTVAWMAGRESAKDELEAKQQETFQMYVDANEARIDAEAENTTLKQIWWDAGDVTDLAGTIADLEAKLREYALQELSALGQASEAYQAQLAAEAKLKWVLKERDTTFALMLKRAETAEAQLAVAVEALDEAVYLLAPTEKDMERQAGIYRIVTTLEELKGQGDE
jgi:hypothetical protein